jgi:hypothetical protein
MRAVARLSSFAGVGLLLVAAASAAVTLQRDVAAFDATRLGGDAASAHRSKFAALRATLPPGSVVRSLGAGRTFEPGEAAIADAVAAALHRELATDTGATLPGFPPDYLRQLVVAFRARHTAAENADPIAVRRNLERWWSGLADDIRQSLTRYALAPHVVVPDGATAFVVGDFPPGFDHAPLAARERLEVVRDFGGGAVLFRAVR